MADTAWIAIYDDDGEFGWNLFATRAAAADWLCDVFNVTEDHGGHSITGLDCDDKLDAVGEDHDCSVQEFDIATVLPILNDAAALAAVEGSSPLD